MLTDVKSDYSVGLAKFFKEGFVAGGGKIIAEENYSGGDKDFNAQLTAIKAANPDGIFVPGYYTEVGLIALQAKQLGITVPFFGGDGWESSHSCPSAARRWKAIIFPRIFRRQDTSPAVQHFVKEFKAKYNETPDAMAALGYDSAMILADAMKTRRHDRRRENPRRAGGDEKFSRRHRQHHDGRRTATPPKPAVILTIKDGAVQYLKRSP